MGVKNDDLNGSNFIGNFCTRKDWSGTAKNLKCYDFGSLDRSDGSDSCQIIGRLRADIQMNGRSNCGLLDLH